MPAHLRLQTTDGPGEDPPAVQYERLSFPRAASRCLWVVLFAVVALDVVTQWCVTLPALREAGTRPVAAQAAPDYDQVQFLREREQLQRKILVNEALIGAQQERNLKVSKKLEDRLKSLQKED